MRALLLAVALLLLVPPAATAQRPPIRISGAFTVTALTADLAYFYRRAVRSPPRFDLVGGRTVTGMSDVARGISDIGLVSRPLGPGDPAGLVFTPFARTGICLVTNRDNPVPGLTRAQIQDLVAARVTTWPQIPGSPLLDPIVAGALTVGGGSRTTFEATLLDDATPQLYVPRTFVTAAQMRDFIKVTRGLGIRRPGVRRRSARRPARRRPVHARHGDVGRLSGSHGVRVRHARRTEGPGRPLHPLGAQERQGTARDRHPLRARSVVHPAASTTHSGGPGSRLPALGIRSRATSMLADAVHRQPRPGLHRVMRGTYDRMY